MYLLFLLHTTFLKDPLILSEKVEDIVYRVLLVGAPGCL